MKTENLVERLEQESIKGLELYIKDMRSQEECAGYIDGFDEAIALVKKLTLCGVVRQGEQLKAFSNYAQKRMWEDGDKDLSEFVDEYLSL